MSSAAAASTAAIPRPVLVCFAVEQEASPFRPLARGKDDVTVLVTGMGRCNAEAGLRRSLAVAKPQSILTCGFAGGLHPSLRSGDIVYDADTSLAPSVEALPARAARFHCATKVAITAASKQELRNSTGADAVEMESGFLREICRQQGIPSATFRVILDTLGEDLPLDFNAITTEELRIDPVRLGLAIARSPGKLPALLAFRKQTRAAAESLARALQRLLTL